MYVRCDEHNADAFAGSYPAVMLSINNILSCALGTILAGIVLDVIRKHRR